MLSATTVAFNLPDHMEFARDDTGTADAKAMRQAAAIRLAATMPKCGVCSICGPKTLTKALLTLIAADLSGVSGLRFPVRVHRSRLHLPEQDHIRPGTRMHSR